MRKYWRPWINSNNRLRVALNNVRKIHFKTIVLIAGIVIGISGFCQAQGNGNGTVSLPPPDTSGGMSLTKTIFERACERSFTGSPLTLQQLGQVLWAGNGSTVDAVTGPTRTAPSAGGLYPVELYVAVGNVTELDPGIYYYNATAHALEQTDKGDPRIQLSQAALGQRSVKQAPMTVIICAVFERTTRKYGDRGGDRYVTIDTGHAAQNVFLQATALDLGTVTIGAFNDNSVKQVLGLQKAEPLLIMPIGEPDR